MIYTIYSEEELPCIKNEIEYIQEKVKKYLGSSALKQDQYIKINTTTDDKAKIQALYNLWKVQCDYGQGVFVITLDLWGVETNMLVYFLEDLTSSKEDTSYNTSIKLKYFGDTITYVVTDNGTKIVSDSGYLCHKD